jgi:DNA-binding MarR family transcriptional regulator
VNAPALPFRIVNWIGIIDQLASTEANRVLRPIGLDLPQFVMLNHFSHRPDEAKTVTAVARALQQPQPGVTKTVQKLVRKGWLGERANGEDGRSKLLVMTAAGRTRHQKAVTALLPRVTPAFAGWTVAEQRQLFELLDRLRLWFDANRS